MICSSVGFTKLSCLLVIGSFCKFWGYFEKIIPMDIIINDFAKKRSEKDTSKVSTSTTTTTPSSTVAMSSQNGSSGNGKPNSGIAQQNQNQLQITGGK